MSTEAAQAADEIERLIQSAQAPSGSLCVFGDWFGRAYDNCHTPVSASTQGQLLTVVFDQGETLGVWEPVGVCISPSQFRIRSAVRVRWEWFFYGRPKLEANLYVEEHWVQDGVVHASTTADWYPPSFQPSMDRPAIDLL